MKEPLETYIARLKRYVYYGATSLMIAVIVALATTALFPGPYHFDFFGVVADRTQQSVSGSSVSVSWVAVLTALVIVPVLAALYDELAKKKS